MLYPVNHVNCTNLRQQNPYSLSEQLIPYYYCGNELLLENLSSLWGNRIIIPIIPECYIL